MEDLHLSLAIIASLALGVFRWMWALAQRLKHSQKNLTATLVVAWMIGYGSCIWDHPLLADWLPFSSLIVLANWFPIFLLALAGVVAQAEQLHLWRRRLLVSVIACSAGFALFQPMLGSPPQCGNEWTFEGDCVQTTEYTCSAASAATLLRAYGIPATEGEMAQLCLTRKGTSWMGLYRGLKLKTENTIWDVEVVECSPTELRSLCQRPMILNVGLPADAKRSDLLCRESGWQPGIMHSVVLLGCEDSTHVRIADPTPTIGREVWNIGTVHKLWQGKAIRLVERFPQTNRGLLASR
jgi:hypothetical protein